MEKILLVSTRVLHYRIRIYNYFYDEFKRRGIDFAVLTHSIQDVEDKPRFRVFVEKPSSRKFVDFIRQYRPDAVITYLNLSEKRIFPVIYYCKINNIPLVYWGHGINLLTPNHPVKNLIYRHLHRISDAITLYTSNELKYIRKRNHPKVFIANNTLDFSNIEPRDKERDLAFVRERFSIREKNIVLFVGRVTSVKRLEDLLGLFRDKDIALVVVGPNIKPHQLEIIERVPNYYYVGAIYDDDEIQAIFNASRFFSIPGNIGLGLNQAFFWSVPVVTLDGLNTPEIIYLDDGVNGYIVDRPEQIEEKILNALADEKLYRSMAINAKKTAETVAHISKMYQGFYDTIQYIHSRKSLPSEQTG